MPEKNPLRIGLLLYPNCMPAGLLSFADLLHGANRRTGARLFEPVFVGSAEGQVECAHGQALRASAALRDSAVDAVLIPGFWSESAGQIANTLAQNAELVQTLARLPRGVMVWSYCTGVCLAAAAGRLNGQAATATWWLADLLRAQYPKVAWQTESTCIFNAKNATASGVNGHLPIAQAFIEQRLSRDAYSDLAKLLVLPRPERTHQAFRMLNLIEQPDRVMRALHARAEQMPAAEASVERLAAELNLTGRTLARKVAAASGLAVGAYVRRVKLNQVSERLIHTSVPASTISAELGFSSDSGMRRMFKELTGMTPAQYRQAFSRA